MADMTLLEEYGTYEEELMGLQGSITAYAGGGQGSATALIKKWNTVSTCANDYDSVALVLSKQGYQQVVFNNTSKILSVYPVSGEKINGIANNQVNILPGGIGSFECASDGNWISYANSNSGILETKITLSASDIKTLYSSPVQVVSAPGVGKAIEVISGSIKYTKASVNYSGGAPIQIITDTALASSNQYQLVSPNSLSSVSFFEKLIQTTSSNNMIENKALMVTNNTSNYANGDGTVTIYISYRIITL